MKAYAVNHTHPHKNTTIINSNFYIEIKVVKIKL